MRGAPGDKFVPASAGANLPLAVASNEPELDPPFDILGLDPVATPFVFSSPHSGRIYPERFLQSAKLDPLSLRRSEDAFVDELFGFAPRFGAPLLRARFPRAYLDVNREPYELDPRMFEGRLPAFANTRSTRVAGGLGTIARIVSESQEIYARRLPVHAAIERIETLYKPYHAALAFLLRRAHAAFGLAVLIDCHSMPSTPGPTPADGRERARADIVLGDRHGMSCKPGLIDAAAFFLRASGYTVLRNKPYAGGFITEHYGHPAAGCHALQIEINRALYMDERTLTPTAGFASLSADLALLAESLLAAIDDAPRAAAE